MILNKRNLLLSATVGAAGAVMTNIVSAKEIWTRIWTPSSQG